LGTPTGANKQLPTTKVLLSCEMSDHKIVGGCSTLFTKVNKK